MGVGTKLETGHVGLNVTDLERSTAFYETALGLQTVGAQTEGDRRFALLGDGGRLLLTLWQQSDGGFDAGRPGLHHLSFQVAGIEDVRRAEARLRGLGVRFHHDGIVAHGEGATAPAGGAPACGFF
jgi:lactoylglutathione lyase